MQRIFIHKIWNVFVKVILVMTLQVFTVLATSAQCIPPPTPTGLTAIAVSSSQINLSWNPVSGVIGYDVYYCNGTYVGFTPTNSYNHTGRAASTTYSYKVAAQKSATCVSSQTTCVSATTPAACVPPAVPTGLTATPISSSQINLSWNSVVGAIGYDVYYCDGTYIGFTSTNSYNHTGRTAATTYSYKISAQKSPTCSSPQTSCVTATTPCILPSTPTGLSATAVSSSQINLSWNPVTGAIGYDIFYCDGTYIGFTSTTSYNHTGRAPSTTYSYKISAQKSSTCNSPQTSCVSATTPCILPATPTGLSATAVSSSQINLTWNSVSGAIGYDVFYCDGTYIGFTSNNSYNHTGRAPSTTYSYKISAQKNSSCNSPQTSCVSATTPCILPATPSGLNATAVSSSQINLSWNGVSGAIGYDVYYCDGTYIGFTTNTSYQHTGRVESTTYSYKIAAQKSATCVSPLTSCVSATTPCIQPSIPTGLTANASSSSQINLSWNAVATATGYDVYYCDGTYIGFTTNTSYQHTGRAESTTYSYKIAAQRSATCISPFTSCVSATTPCLLPLAPTGLSALAVSATQINLAWNSVPGTVGYKVYYCDGTYIGFTANTFFHHSGRLPGTSYSYKVTAQKSATCVSPMTACVSTTTFCFPPLTPSGFTATTVSSSQINLNWNGVAGAIGYDIYYCDGTYIGFTANTAYHHTGRVPATTYSYKIAAQKSPACVSPLTSCVSATTLSGPPCTGVVISLQPQPQTASTGNTASFSVSVTGTGPFQYTWYRNNIPVQGTNSANYTTPILTTADNGNTYRCVITNCNSQNGTTSSIAGLTVNTGCSAVSVSTQPRDQNAAPGTTATFSFSTTGTGATYQWQYSNDGGSSWLPVPLSSSYIGSNSSSLEIFPVTTNLNGYKYRCLVSGPCTSSFFTTAVTLNIHNKLWVNKPIGTDRYSLGQTFPIGWGDFIRNNVAIGQSGFVEKKYKIEITANNGSTWTTIRDQFIIPNAITGQNNNFLFDYAVTTAPGTYKIRVTDKDDLSNNNISDPFLISSSITNGFKLSLEWDKSAPMVQDGKPLIGLAADGTCRILLKLTRQSGNPKVVLKIRGTIKALNNISTGTDTLGRILHCTNPNIYSLEGNNASSTTDEWIANQPIASTSFWLIAPNDFTQELNDQRPERQINAEFLITYTDGSTETVSTSNSPIIIVRPVLFLVHGLDGSDQSFNEAIYQVTGMTSPLPFDKQGQKNPLWKNAQRLNMYNYESFAKNAELLLGLSYTTGKYFNTIPSQLDGMHYQGYAANKVDYVSHSMGGCVARSLINHPSGAYLQGVNSATGSYRNYSQGFINKLITICTPHNGSHLADLAVDRYQFSAITAWAAVLSLRWNSGYFVNGVPSPALLDLQAYHGGVRLGFTNVKNHLIGSDLDFDNNLSTSYILDNSDWKTAFLYARLLFRWENVHDFVENRYGNNEYLSNTDLVVPVSSQLSSIAPSESINIENNASGAGTSSIIYGLDKDHTGIQRNLIVGTRVMRLLNAPINSPYFANSIPANTNPINRSHRIALDSVINYYDSTHIRIVNPPRNEIVIVDSVLSVDIHLTDTTGLRQVSIGFQGEVYVSSSRTPNQQFNVNLLSNSIGKNILIAEASYDSAGYIINHADTLTLNVRSNDSLTGFYVLPHSQILNPGQLFYPDLMARFANYSGSLNPSIDSLSFEIADTNVVRYDSIQRWYITKDTGTTHIRFQYKDYTDTAFIYVSKPGEQGSQPTSCPGGSVSFFAGTNDPTKTYQWQIDSTNGFQNLTPDPIHTRVDSSILLLTNPPTSFYNYRYRCIITDNIGQTASQIFTLKFVVSWTGNSSSAWENPANWNCGSLPDSNTDVIIPFSANHSPVVNSNASCRSLTLRSASTVVVNSGFTLNITGKNP